MVINEVDYDQVGTDTEEFIELKNISTHAVNLNGWQLRLFNAATETVYQTISLPNVNVAAGDYFVVCANPSLMCECDLDVSPDTDLVPVSYTHLDVYKRQGWSRSPMCSARTAVKRSPCGWTFQPGRRAMWRTARCAASPCR